MSKAFRPFDSKGRLPRVVNHHLCSVYEDCKLQVFRYEIDQLLGEHPVLTTSPLQGYLAHKNERPSRTLHKEYARGPLVVLGGDAVSYERGTPVNPATYTNA